jgi:hypothetical protein
MNKLTALLQFVLALFGLDLGERTLVHHVDAGATQLHSRTLVEAGVARFECLRSASGECHYVVYPRDCATPAAVPHRCGSRPLEQFTIASGDTRQIVGLSGFRLCVGPDRDPAHADCQRI